MTDLTPQISHMAEPAENIIGFIARERSINIVRRRARNLGAESLADHELLALHLPEVAGVDVLDQAERLLERFGSLAAVLAATESTLCHLMGVDVGTAITATREIGRRVLHEPIVDRPVMSNWAAVERFLRNEMSHSEVEIFAVLWLDHANHLIRYEQLWTGDAKFAPVFAKEFVRRAIERGAVNCIISHCHPSRSAEPSSADILMTKKLKECLALVDIKMHDHVIVAGDKVVSMHSLGLM